MKWWIVEDALKDKKGHYFEYVKTFKDGLEACGDEVGIFIDKDAEDWLSEKLEAKRVLPNCIWRRMNEVAPKWKKLLRYPIHGFQTFAAYRRLLKGGNLPDVVFVPSVSVYHLLGLVPLLLAYAKRSPVKYLLFFPSTPIRYNKQTDSPETKPDPTAKIFPKLLAALGGLVKDGKVILGAETQSMKSALEKLSGVPFTYFPHPVSLNLATKDTEFSGDREILLGCYGPARHEKGSDLLQEAIAIFLQKNPSANTRFAIQWLDDFRDENGRTISKDPVLMQHPKVQYITEYFAPDGGYLRQVSQTDIMLLPYRDSYRYRLSRVVIESMLAGVPVVVSDGTTLCDQAVEHGVATVFEMDSVSGLTDAIEKTLDQFETVSRKARDRALPASQHFSVEHFREIMAGKL